MLTIEALDKKHTSYDLELWADLSALYRGGKAFRDRIESFLHKNPVETDDIYVQRKREACYRSYLGPIIDYYSAWLFSGDFKIRAAREGEPVDKVDDVYAEFREDIGGDTDMKSFLKHRFTKALIDGRSHWICELPVAKTLEAWPDSKSAYETSGLKKATLRPVDACELLDWETGDDGLLDWCSVYSAQEKRKSIGDTKRTVIETWHVYDREVCTIYQISYLKGESRPGPTEKVEPLRTYKHGFLQVPLVTLQIPEGLWIANRVSDPQKAHFRLGSALDWSIKRTCYAMPVFKLVDETKPPVMGAGYWIMIGDKEDMTWAAPPQGHFDVISKEVDVQRNDIYRMTNQMALGLDNNAETVGRSADSKSQDNAATRIMLNAYGAIMTDAIEETYEIVSDAFGDEDLFWSIEGFNGFDPSTAPEVIANATNVQLLNIPSPTFLKEVKKKAAFATLPELSQGTKDTIGQEISDGIDNDQDMTDILSAGYVPLPNRTAVSDAANQAKLAADAKAAAGAQKAPAGGSKKPSKS